MRSVKRLAMFVGLLAALPGVLCAQLPDGVAFSGFVDASYYGDLNTGDDTIGLDQVELDIIRETGNGIVLRADLETTGGDGAVSAEQGYMSYTPEAASALTLTIGKFNAPIGFEMLDAPDMYQYSHSLVFDNCLPTNLSGLMAGWVFTDNIGVTAYIVNGWDNNTENNGPMSVGGRLGLSFEDNIPLSLGISVINGKENAVKTAAEENLQVIDIDFSISPLERLLIGSEFNLGSVKDAADQEYGWTGFMVMANYGFAERFALTLRFDMLMDDDALLFGDGDVSTVAIDSQTRNSLAISPSYSLGNGMGVLVEYRMDMSDYEVFTDPDGGAKKSTSGFAFEMTYTF